MTSRFEEELGKRILVLDGAMGTMIQMCGAGGGNNDMLCVERPDVIRRIHRAYLEAGADIIETNSFNAQRISQSEYGCESRIREINLAAAKIAREEADRMSAETPEKPRFVAGSVGPTGKTASMSQDVEKPGARDVCYGEFVEAYEEQVEALVEGGVDLILIETIFDTLNAKACIEAVRKVSERKGKRVPVMLSCTIADEAGRLLSGQSVEAFIVSVSQYMKEMVVSVGLNCSFGAEKMLPYLKRIRECVPCYVSAHPNAGMPDIYGVYSQDAKAMRRAVEPFLEQGLVNIIGGCCGSTPDHIGEIAKLVSPYEGGKRGEGKSAGWLSGLDAYTPSGFVKVGERCNVAGSRKFLRLINEGNYEEALSIARKQVADGANVIDVNMDDGMLDAEKEMVAFLRMMGSDPEVARLPWMIDSSRFNVIEKALGECQGKCIVNSLSLKEGEEVFLTKAKKIKEAGAALVVMAFDEEGQATTYERKITVCERAYRLLVDKIGFNCEDIIFDPNILTIGTGIAEHAEYGADFIKAAKWIKENLKGAHVSGGVSNLSFAFRGNNYLRECIHSVFLHHASRVGMDMGIVNAGAMVKYEEIGEEVRATIEDLIFNRREDAVERMLEKAEGLTAKKEEKKDIPQVALSIEERISEALRKGENEGLEAMMKEVMEKYGSAAAVVEGPLMSGMMRVGDLFAEGKMFLPQVVKTARTMKAAVGIVMPKEESKTAEGAPKCVMATVKGDVHDIGKNIAGVVLGCNGYEVIDLGVMVEAKRIVETVISENADFVGLSGLITPSLEEMVNVARELKKAGVSKPLFIGGATTSALHTAVKIAPEYEGAVFWVKDASQNPVIASQLMSGEREKVIACLKYEQEKLRREAQAKKSEDTGEDMLKYRKIVDFGGDAPEPSFVGTRVIERIEIRDIIPYINWIYFYHLWGVKANSAEGESVKHDAEKAIEEMCEKHWMRAVVGLFEANGTETGIEFANGVFLETPRQKKRGDDGFSKALCDYVSSKGNKDYVGVFAITICSEMAEEIEKAKRSGDQYKALIMQSTADRLAEATSEYLHEKVRRELWGYAKEEKLEIGEMFKARYEGIRPAVGYPSLPDQKAIFKLAELIDYGSIGITLTENGAMYPQASVSGIYMRRGEYFTGC